MSEGFCIFLKGKKKKKVYAAYSSLEGRRGVDVFVKCLAFWPFKPSFHLITILLIDACRPETCHYQQKPFVHREFAEAFPTHFNCLS